MAEQPGRTRIMGILNVTPDSFSDGGLHHGLEDIVAHAAAMVEAGADIIDIGGESTRPFADPVSIEEELARVVPAVAAVASQVAVPISVDTTKSRVAREAIAAGATMLNDISGLRFDPAMAGLAAESGLPLVIMHMQGTPGDMQQNPVYDDVVGEICDFFRERLHFCEKSGINPNRVILDPGIGFGKTLEHNLAILAELDRFRELGREILIGHSRKSFLAALLDLETAERDCATAMISCLCAARGADYLRVHDVALTRQAITIAQRTKPAH